MKKIPCVSKGRFCDIDFNYFKLLIFFLKQSKHCNLVFFCFIFMIILNALQKIYIAIKSFSLAFNIFTEIMQMSLTDLDDVPNWRLEFDIFS